MPNVRLIKHEAVPRCVSYEVRFPDGRPLRFFYRDGLPERRLNPNLVASSLAVFFGFCHMSLPAQPYSVSRWKAEVASSVRTQ
jgi:hypothetical protein